MTGRLKLLGATLALVGLDALSGNVMPYASDPDPATGAVTVGFMQSQGSETRFRVAVRPASQP